MDIISRLGRYFSSITWRFVAIFLLVTVIALGTVTIVIIRMIENNQIRDRINYEFENLNSVAVRVSPLLYERNSQAIYDLLNKSSQENGGRYLVLDKNSIVIGDSFSKLNGRRISVPEINNVLNGSKDTDYGFYQIDSGENFHVIYLTIALNANAETIGTMLLSTGIQDVFDQTGRLNFTIILISVITAAVVVFISLLTSNYITRPIVKLTSAAVSMSGGNLRERVNIKGKSEIAMLGNAFNEMGEQLQNIDTQRADFVSNVSHELRTPLSSIKILVESLIYQDDTPKETVKEFLTDVNFEIDRLNSIITDLLEITKLEDAALILKLEMTDLSELLKHTFNINEPLFSKHNVSMKIEEDEDFNCLCDKLKIDRAISNLIYNAIRYTPEGGDIQISMNQDEDNIHIFIRDTGIGIEEDELPHIFERFYRVDKARSRDTGGTGLGLYITKKIILLHGGNIIVTSAQNAGSTFEVILKREKVL